jgi:hypothetical protein
MELPAAPAGALGHAAQAVELAKRQMQVSVALTLEVAGQKLIENQEAAARVADMAMEIYVMESAVVRAERMVGAGHRFADYARDCAEVFVNEAVAKVSANARFLLAEVLEGDALEQGLGALRSLDRHQPVSSSVLRGRIAARLTERGGYPIEHF